jgi:hypothetical protein
MTTTTDFDSILDMQLDDIADLPEFKVFPAGAHRVTIKFEKKEINKHPAMELKLKLIETVEMVQPDEVAPAAGTESSVAFMMDNEFGMGKFKEVLKPLAAHLGFSRVSEIIEQSADMECLVVTKVRQNKEKTQNYLDIVSLQVM